MTSHDHELHRTGRSPGRLAVASLSIALSLLLLPRTAVGQDAATGVGAAPIASVVVYGDRAQVTRTRAVSCSSGEAVFAGLPSTLDTKTLAASLAGDGGGEVVGIKHLEEATGPQPRAEALQDELRQVDVALVQAGGEIASARTIETKLESFKQHLHRTWKVQAIGRQPPVGTWDQALDLLREQALRASSKRRAAELQQTQLRRQRNRLQAELDQVRQARRRTTVRVTAVVRCSGTRTVRLSYVVPDATWRIAYQVRTRPGSDQVSLLAQALVQQGTGEDWKGVRLAVSTANLQRRNTPPQIQPLRVSTRKPASTRKVLARRFERREHLKAALPSGTVASGTIGGAEAPAAGRPDQGLAVELLASERATVPADGRQIAVTLAQRALRAAVALETVPKLYPYVYRKLALHNPFPFLMLPGEVSLFAGRSFVGRARVELRAPREPFDLSLGVDNQVQVRRYVKQEKLAGSGAFGASKRLRHRYVIQVGNWTGKTRQVRVLENLPVAQVSEIEVALDDDATRPASWNKEDGILGWKLRVPPRQKREIVVAYTVDVPKSYVVTGYE